MIPQQKVVERIIEADECEDKGMDDEGYISSVLQLLVLRNTFDKGECGSKPEGLLA
jgi:hypothetical protein